MLIRALAIVRNGRKLLRTETTAYPYLGVGRRRGDDSATAFTLQLLSRVNQSLNLYEEGIGQAKEALGIFERIGTMKWQGQCLGDLARLLLANKQLEEAENVASRAINLAIEEGQDILVCRLHRVLGGIYTSKGEKKRAIHHFEAAIGIASPFNWDDVLFWNHYGLADLFCLEGEFGEANTHIKQARSHAVDDPYQLARAMEMQALIWYQQLRFEEARSEASHALEIYEGLGAAKALERCTHLLQDVEQAM